MCGDLACSLYVRGRKQAAGTEFDDLLGVEEKVARLRGNLETFLGKVTR
jgi:hypothetical protein